MYDITSKKMLLIGQVSLLFFAAILAFIPQYYILVFILYLVVMFALTAFMQRRAAKGDKNRIMAGRVYFEEKNAMEIALQDEQLVSELTAQARLMSISFASLFIALGVFWIMGLYRDDIIRFFSLYVDNESLQLFLYWLLLFETIFVINRGITVYLARGRKAAQPLIPNQYVVTDRGIASPGVFGVALEFPLPDNIAISLNEKQRFVEIVVNENRRIRLYTKKPQKLYDIITSLNRRAKKRTSRG